ncbi:MAG TPA: hypothetical protein VH092_27190 [Urbifossiella sp.]|jgi:hypothetical protein|nr:hypothetical protein [Urbifossiella sp.]
MSTLGKVLLVFNLLVGGGFAYLALQDWKGRQEIAAAGFRHLVLLNGVPLGDQKGDPETMPTDPEAEIPFVIEGPGGKPTATVGPPLLKAYFAPAAGTMDPGSPPLAAADPVPSQLVEVRRVQGVVKTYIEGQADDAKRALAAFKLLVYQAETLEERQQAQALLAAGKMDELTAGLYARFDRVLKAPAKADTSALAPPDGNEDEDKTKERLGKAAEVREVTKDDPERRARLAHLLVHLDPSAAWQKRVMMVVGVKRYIRTVAVQAIRLSEMTARVRRLTDDDQNRFVAEYAQLREIATRRTQDLRDRTELERRLDDQERRDADAVKQLETQLDDPTTGLKAQLAQVKNDVSQLLARQTLTERDLFRIEREVADTLADVYQMEARLREVERERYRDRK